MGPSAPLIPRGAASGRVREQHRVWEAIAHSFDASRTRRWPHVEAFLRTLPAGSRVLDLMAGNGRHVASIEEAGHRAVWLDWSRPMARLAGRRYPRADVVVGDVTALPLRDACVDAAIVVAGLHSVPTAEGRARCLQDLHRVLRPGGEVQVTVWSRDAPRFRAIGNPGEDLDVVLPWRSHGHDEPRPYHLYTQATLRRDLGAAGFEVTGEGTASVVGPDDNLVAHAWRPA
jgi:ubiquinone/menaquinone biosynthesis C-methylase UbiE